MEIPRLSKELIQMLDEIFPEQTPDIAWPDREIWVYAGKRDLIRKLKQWLQDTEEVDLSDQ